MTSITSHFSHDPAQPDLTPAVRLIDGTRFTGGAQAGTHLGDMMTAWQVSHRHPLLRTPPSPAGRAPPPASTPATTPCRD